MAPVRRGETQKTSPALDERRSEDGLGRGGAKSNIISVLLLFFAVFKMFLYLGYPVILVLLPIALLFSEHISLLVSSYCCIVLSLCVSGIKMMMMIMVCSLYSCNDLKDFLKSELLG